eukprot:2488129-Amphidinium_carterae.1
MSIYRSHVFGTYFGLTPCTMTTDVQTSTHPKTPHGNARGWQYTVLSQFRMPTRCILMHDQDRNDMETFSSSATAAI